MRSRVLWAAWAPWGFAAQSAERGFCRFRPHPLCRAPPIGKHEADALLAALKPPKRRRPLIAIIGINNATETKDIKKYAVSRSGKVDTSWQGSVLLRDIADVKRLGEEDGPNLVTQGSTELVHALLANDLVEAMSIFTVPVVLGSGKKLFTDGSTPHAYKLTRSRISRTGLMIAHYERDGEIKMGDTALDKPSKAEEARRERMKREG